MRRLVVLALVAGCGDGIALPDDGGAPTEDPRARVTLQLRGDRVAGHEVFFQDSDSSLALVTRTDGGGRASAMMDAGGFVTVVERLPFGLPQDTRIFTYTDVQPGDVLELDLGRAPLEQPFMPLVTVRVSPLDGATQYRLYSHCSEDFDVSDAIDAAAEAQLFVCDLVTDLAVVALDPGGSALGYRALRSVDLTEGILEQLDLRGAYVPMRTTIDFVAAPGVEIFVRQQAGEFESFTPLNAFGSAFVAQGESQASVELPMPGGGPLPIRTWISPFSSLLEPGASAPSLPFAYEWGPARSLYSYDLLAHPLRTPREPRFDPTSFVVSWTEDPSAGAPGNVVHLTLDFDLKRWTVIARRTDETLVRLPRLPRSMLRPLTAFVRDLTLVDVEGGYDYLRTHLTGHWSANEQTIWPTDAPSGRLFFRPAQ